MYYKPKYFKPKELLPEDFYADWGDLGLQFMDAGLLHDLDVIREALQEYVYVNTSTYNWSGLRTSDWEDYNPTSLHSAGKAIDFKISSWIKGDLTTRPTEEVVELVMKLKKEGKLKYITAIELNTSSWVHIDTRNRAPNHKSGLFVFNG